MLYPMKTFVHFHLAESIKADKEQDIHNWPTEN